MPGEETGLDSRTVGYHWEITIIFVLGQSLLREGHGEVTGQETG